MLSNFQFGNQALLQSFLVGQPEFREILQRPEMEQFRQRVAATCHIGPLDADETRQYIEHRLKCAGRAEPGLFDAAAVAGVFEASHGIPRRINAVCDRMMLAGFLGGHPQLTRDLLKENTVPQSVTAAPALASAEPQMPGGLAGQTLELDAGRLQLDAEQVEGMSQQIAGLAADQRGDQLQRLERSMLRLERSNLQTLALLQTLVAALKKPGGSER
jgi:hypothetical protein